ncbi:ABC transporter ATP-binding protein [Pseudomonas putida S12]|uniref:ABC transporter ATP-binding protein n=1 Tax=Pseudomonas putida S12 TaxID=1215087 RepID=A0AA34RY58_PSEPU|nr:MULTISPECIES: ATP-binding cassette domain-containing protein [Pseudomonas]AJA15690.1 ABC transporter ATP-binding protein [Pseudomonas putida S12]TFF51975.1 ABC transporter ATP-binding protein [Pseudomonas putida]USX35858.1 ATP-binding cassette domain-containing protein [Pseudomonas putida]
MTNTSILTLDSVSLALPDGRPLFSNLNETFDQRRTGLVGRNGVGKSLLGQILAGRREPSSGHCRRLGLVHLLDQQVIARSATLADLAQVGPVIAALERIEQGSIKPQDFDTVGERWDMREQLQLQLQGHGLGQLDWRQPARTLSGGQAMRVALIGAWLSDADYLILDEPSNHLDSNARAQLLSMIEEWDRGLLVISHDRSLLAHMARIVELSSLGLQAYGGNYSLYSAQKANQTAQAQQQLARLKQEQQRQARELQRQREDLERHQARAGRQAKHANQAKILVDRKQERSQATAGKQRRDHRDARQTLLGKVRDAAREVEQDSAITLHAPAPQRHPGREVLALQALCLPHGTRKALDLRLCLGQRVGLIGANGSGKSTLLRLLNGELPASPDNVHLSGETALLDQHCSTLAGNRSVLEHLRQANPTLAQGKLRSRLAQLGLDAARIELPSSLLSGGERMKAALAAVLYRERPLDLLLLDEPGNHLDLPSLTALERMLGQFRGALIVASHDAVLLENLALDEYLLL